MDINKNIGDINTFSLGMKISFGSLDFIVDRLGDLQLCDPEPVCRSPSRLHMRRLGTISEKGQFNSLAQS
jgi:hypothetical protein